LHKHFTEVEGEFSYAKGVDGTTTEEIQEALEDSIKGTGTRMQINDCGVMIRSWSASVWLIRKSEST